LLERSINLEIKEAYSKLRTILLEKDCRVISEEPPKQILIRHGSLRGISPRSAKKEVSYSLSPQGQKTRITYSSSISSDWVNLTLWGNVAAAIVAAVFWWIASDITVLIVDGSLGYWTWLARAFGYPNIQYALFMINITKALSIVLAVAILLEILDFFIVHRKINTFATETLNELSKIKFSI
jgi:hypothetical protein